MTSHHGRRQRDTHNSTQGSRIGRPYRQRHICYRHAYIVYIPISQNPPCRTQILHDNETPLSPTSPTHQERSPRRQEMYVTYGGAGSRSRSKWYHPNLREGKKSTNKPRRVEDRKIIKRPTSTLAERKIKRREQKQVYATPA